MGTIWIAFILSFSLAGVRATQFAASVRIPVFYSGIGLLVGGSVLRRVCWRALGEHFTGDVRAERNQPVIQTGPYRWVRHPSYTGAMMMYIGVGIALANWLSVGALALAAIISYGYRVRVEERALLSEIGEPYAAYMKTHKRFIPFIV